MKTAAVIAEFNPFHNGHKYLLEQIKKEYGIDHCIAIMSGDYVQRGDVAIIAKHKRAEMAVKAGFSAVFELPSIYATSSAPDFAYGAVCIADALGVDYLAFGSESGDLSTLNTIADAMKAPDPQLDNQINTNVKKGMSYAKAVSDALISCGIIREGFSAPNDILAMEYIKVLKNINSKVEPIAIKRCGVHHNSTEAHDNIASASLLRSQLKEEKDISTYLPESFEFKPLFIDDFFSLLSYQLLFLSDDELSSTSGISKDLSNKIRKYQNATDFRALVDACKSKNFSESTIRRGLIHILLDMQKNDSFYPQGHIVRPNAVRLLAASKESSSVLRNFKEKEAIHIVTKPKEVLDNDFSLLLQDIKVSNLYEKVYSQKYSSSFTDDFRKSPVII